MIEALKTRVALIFLVLVAATTKPTTRPAGKEFDSTDSIVEVIAKWLPAKTSGWTEMKREAANRALARDVVGHEATLRYVVADVRRNEKAGDSAEQLPWVVYSTDDHKSQSPIWIWSYFDDDQKDAVAAINKSDTVTVTGRIWHCTIGHQGDRYPLLISITWSKLVKKP